MLQFQTAWRLRVFGGVRYESEARRVVAQAAEAGAVVVFSLVNARIVEVLMHESERRGVTAVDLLGPLIARLADRLSAQPRNQPGLLHSFSDEYFQRVEAVEFAVLHDDGANLATLYQADIVLTGVSRTSKTPLCMYLAQRGYKTGNVPLVRGMDAPRELLELDRHKVFGLVIDPSTLTTIRQARLRAMKAPSSTFYTDSEGVAQEIERSRRLFRRRGWRVIDISGRAVEENASRIIAYHGANHDDAAVREGA